MSDLHVVATITAKDGTESEVGAALKRLAEGSRGESGCVAYEVYESAASPGTFVTVEQWKSQEDLDAHMREPHVAEALGSQADNITVAIHPLKSL